MSDDRHDDVIEDDDEPSGPPGPAAAYASNWRTVLAVDALVGVAIFVVGVLVMGWILLVGAFVAALGCTYVVLVGRRAREWARLRRAAGR